MVCHKIEFSFNYHNLILLKKQNQYAQKFNCRNFFIYNTHIFLHPFEYTTGCTTTELKFCDNVGPLKLELRLS